MRGKTQTAVCFEGDQIRVVEAAIHEGTWAVKEVLTFAESDFPLYLKQAKADEFLVTCDFPDLVHEIILVPPAKAKYLGALVEREIKKSFPDLNDFSFAFHVIREQVRDGKKTLEVAVYAVTKSRLRDIVNTFEASGKRVSFLYPTILPITTLVHTSFESEGEVLLTVIDQGTTKTLLVSQNGQVLFLRVIQSRASGIDDIDADNINMTVTYSRQTLRLDPARLVVLDARRTPLSEEMQARLILPVLNLALPSSVLLDTQFLHDDIYSAVALFLFAPDLSWGNLIPAEHTAFFLKKSILRYGASFFICSSLVLSCYCLKTLAEIPRLKDQMSRIRTEMSRRQSVWSEWIKARDELNVFTPLISFSNTIESSPDVISALQALSFLPLKDVKVRALRFSNTPEGIKVEIKGELTAEKYGEMSNIYQRLLQTVKQTGGIEVRSHSFEVKTKTFSLEGLLRQEGRSHG